VANGSDGALPLPLLLALEIGPATKVITRAFTFLPRPGPWCRAGPGPVFADIDAGYAGIWIPGIVEAKITRGPGRLITRCICTGARRG